MSLRQKPAAAPTPPPPKRVSRRRLPKSDPPAPAPATPVEPVSLQQLRDAWPEILDVVQNAKRAAWMVVFTSTARALDGDVLTLTFPSEKDVASFRQGPAAGDSVSEHLRAAIQQVLGIRVKFIARGRHRSGGSGTRGGGRRVGRHRDPDVGRAGTRGDDQARAGEGGTEVRGEGGAVGRGAAREPAAEPTTEPAVEPEPVAEPEPAAKTESAPKSEPASVPAPAPVASAKAAPAHPATNARYGEAVVREMLGASFIEEISLSPRDRAVPLDPER